jgi:hypothetical protein
MRESIFSLPHAKCSSNDGTICSQRLRITIAKPRELRRASGNEAGICSTLSHRSAGQEQTKRPDCSAMRVTASCLSKHPAFAISPRRAELLAKLVPRIFPFRDPGDAFECREKGMSGTTQHFKGHIRMRSCATAIDQSGLRCQIRFLDQGVHCEASEKISPRFVVAFCGA